MPIVFPHCSRCDCEEFNLSYDTDKEILYCDCAECGLKVVKFDPARLSYVIKNTDH